MKYPKLKGVSKTGSLASKLAKEAIFGEEVMAKCTVKGHRNYPALPSDKLAELKRTLLTQFPDYWQNPAEFETIWSNCEDSIGQACKHIRKKLNLI